MKIACLCPTYKRPGCLANVMECFDAQEYNENQRHLFILDDAGQYDDQDTESITFISTVKRFPNLPAKFSALAEMANAVWNPDAFCVWEDDDVYFSDYLSRVAHSFIAGGQLVSWHEIWGTYGQSYGEAIREGADGRFHASLSFTADLLAEIDGWPQTRELIFDQQFLKSLKTAAGRRWHVLGREEHAPSPSYVYRWGNNIYHGSQFGDGVDWYDQVGRLNLPDAFQGKLEAQIDQETVKLIQWCGKGATIRI